MKKYIFNLLAGGLILLSGCSDKIEGNIRKELIHPKTAFDRYEIELDNVKINGEKIKINKPFVIDGSRPGSYHGKARICDNTMHPTAYIRAEFTERADGFYCETLLRYTGPDGRKGR